MRHTPPPALSGDDPESTATAADLLDRYLANELPSHERVAFERHLTKSQDLTSAVARLQQIDDLSAVSAADIDVEAGWQRQRQRMASAIEYLPSRHASRRLWAAGALAGTALGVIAFYRAATSPSLEPAQTYVTRVGQRAPVTLIDGSRITLAPRSRLVVAGDFGRGSRAVTVSGEAYFVVSHATGTVFTVRTGAVTTRVLGTAFDVRHYTEDSLVQIAVITGKVAIQQRGAPMMLAAGHILQVTDSGMRTMVLRDPEAIMAWTEGRLNFTDTPVRSVLAIVGRWYGYDFQFADSTLATQHVTVGLAVDQPRETLAILQDVLGVTMTFHGNVVTLMPRQALPGHTSQTHSHEPQSRSAFTEVGK